MSRMGENASIGMFHVLSIGMRRRLWKSSLVAVWGLYSQISKVANFFLRSKSLAREVRSVSKFPTPVDLPKQKRR